MKVAWGMMIALLISIRNVVSFSGVIGYASGGILVHSLFVSGIREIDLC